MTGREAFFALMGIKMISFSKQYKKNLEELHDLFYSVSCDWESLEYILNAQKADPVNSIKYQEQIEKIQNMQWTVLEDLAIIDDKESEAYLHVVERKGENEVIKRRQFLQVDV